MLYGAVRISKFLAKRFLLNTDRPLTPVGRNQEGHLLARGVHIEGAQLEEEIAGKTEVKHNDHLEQDVLDLSQTALFQLASNCLG